MNYEAALTFSTGFAVNLGVISSLIGRKDVVILDNLDHACILDGARLSFGRVLKYPHNDMDSLEERLRSVEAGRSKMIVVDGVFSMEGDLAEIPRIVELKKKFDARLMIDDAHGIGVMGEHGRGTAEHFGLEHEADLVMGTDWGSSVDAALNAGVEVRFVWGSADPIGEPALARGFSGAGVEIVDGADHRLPLTHGPLCAQQLRAGAGVPTSSTQTGLATIGSFGKWR